MPDAALPPYLSAKPLPAIRQPPIVRSVSAEQSSQWLSLGWQDLKASPMVSLCGGALFCFGAYLITITLAVVHATSLIFPMLAGFMLVAPVGSIGFYEASRRRSRNQSVTMRDLSEILSHSSDGLLLMGLALAMAFLVWAFVAVLIFAGFYQTQVPSFETLLSLIWTTPQAPLFILVGTAVGGVIATCVFAISAISVPLIVDRDVDVVTAMITSVNAVILNARVMVGWSATLVMLTGVGFVTGYLGLIITLPLVGHATWHAYKAMVVPE